MKNLALKILSYLSKKTAALVERAKMTEYTFMIVAALIIGVLAGFGAILIRTMISEISSFSFPGTADLLTNIIENPWVRKLFVPALGGLIVGPLIYFFAKEAKGHGVPEVMQAIILRGGVIRPRVAVIKAIASAVTIGTGGSVGREGPIVQIGSSVGSAVGQFFRVSSHRLKTFVGCGAAAGIAAAFNAPVAGALFSVEIILQDFAFAHFSPIVVSSVMATVVSHAFEGDFAAFKVPAYKLTSPYELIFYFILAVLSALVGHLFIRLLYFSEDFFDDRLKFPEYLKPVIGGFIIGGGALFFPEIMGVGYESINSALHGNTIWYMALLLLFAKVLATSITLGSGGSGGIFVPSLFLGAMTGVFFGGLVHSFFPEISSDPGAYALVAMGGLISATTYAPITAIVIVFELTNDYHVILPLMITCIMSTIISLKLSRESIYTKKLVNRNILVKDGTDSNVMKGIMVKDVYTDTVDIIDDHMKFDEVINRVVASHEKYFPVVNRRGTISGIISMNEIKEHLYDRDMLQHVLIAEDISNKHFKTVNPGDNCQDALDIMSSHDLDGLPVIKSVKSKKLIGMIWRKNIVDEYNREIEKRDFTSSFASRITMKNIDSHVHFMEGYAITEIPVPRDFLGNSILELDIRKKYGVDILLIRCNSEGNSKIKAIPNPDYRFSINDSLVIAGEIGKLNLMKSL
jgi:chloride channel protein, CIC family